MDPPHDKSHFENHSSFYVRFGMQGHRDHVLLQNRISAAGLGVMDRHATSKFHMEGLPILPVGLTETFKNLKTRNATNQS